MNLVPIEETAFYRDFVEIADECYALAKEWDEKSWKIIGDQLTRAAFSVGANLSEGDGRGSDADCTRMYYIARGSAKEVIFWLERATAHNLIERDRGKEMVVTMQNGLIPLDKLIAARRGK